MLERAAMSARGTERGMEVSYVRLGGMLQATSSHVHRTVKEVLALANRTVQRDRESPCVGERKLQY